jgi:23S rRNA (cytidine1920-2'-O)/16S rRNA (cytidine1409-2'-O)-methyltransferase
LCLVANPPKKRLDVLLVERGLAASRSEAVRLILAGEVGIAGAPDRLPKPGTLVATDAEVSISDKPRYASRGGLKLEHALETLPIDVSGRRCLDVGASTGGFTDCLLQHGAAHVVALDVAYGALDLRLRENPRVTVLERRNARGLGAGDLPYAPNLIVVDVSFIGLAKVLPAVVDCAAPRFDLLALVKPQFELGRSQVGKGGVVRNARDRLHALVSVGEVAAGLRLSVCGYCASGLPGPAGNLESFIWCAEEARGGVVNPSSSYEDLPSNEDRREALRAAALEAEPEALEAAAR